MKTGIDQQKYLCAVFNLFITFPDQ